VPTVRRIPAPEGSPERRTLTEHATAMPLLVLVYNSLPESPTPLAEYLAGHSEGDNRPRVRAIDALTALGLAAVEEE